MKDVVRAQERMVWESPGPNSRTMGLYFEKDITPTKNISVGNVILPAGQEQTKLSEHKCEEVYFIVSGKGQFVLNEQFNEVEQGTAIYVAPGTKHRAINTGDEPMELLWVNTPPFFGGVDKVEEMLEGWKRIQ